MAIKCAHEIHHTAKIQKLRVPFFLPSKLLHNLLLLPLVEDVDVTVVVSFGMVCCIQKLRS